ncbi:hypothetical protein GCM10019016_039570 [Streptomyces prasinosporus]|uniref:Dienelactone hydrolase domain-containing protein n=1 Tax=Streptomyces prasinosporus TaxID=68256 RepID=A0ABP6TRX3_9ACTN
MMTAGALPVFADIDPGVVLPRARPPWSAAVTPRTAAVVVVHRFGGPADLGTVARPRADGTALLVLEHGESEAPYDEIARRRERAAFLDAKLRGVRTPESGVGTPISSTSCGCRGTGVPIGTPSHGPYAPRALTAGCR